VTYPDHFSTVDGALAPQPWMQLRRVADTATPAVSRTYGASGGQAKNEILQTVTATWTNHTPLTQYVYGFVHQGGCAVSLHSRSRGYIRVSHGYTSGLTPKATPTMTLTEVSRFGGGADVGMGGLLAIGSAYGIHEVRSHSTSVPLMPHLTGWKALKPSETITATAEVRFVSEFWENTSIDGGTANTNSTVIAGDLGLDLWAVPQIEEPGPRLIPIVVAQATGVKVNDKVTVKVTGIKQGDVLLAIAGNQWGQSSDITPPDNTWKLLHSVNDGTGFSSLNGTHLRVFARQASGSESGSFTFGNVFLSEEIVHLMLLRGAALPTGDVDTTGWSIASTRNKWAQKGDMHVAPSLSSNGQLLICASFFGRTDNPLDLILGPAPGTQTAPPGMNLQVDSFGKSASLCVATLSNPPNPTGPRQFTSVPRAFFSNFAISVSILVPGAQQIG
jgi:hypothetical protein